MEVFVVKILETLERKKETVKIKTDNTTAEVFSNSSLKEKMYKNMGHEIMVVTR